MLSVKRKCSKPFVSVLMTTFNREAYVADAIESVLNSTYANLELIIVDDCSSDRSVDIASEYVQRDDRVAVIQNEQNLGDYPNRNRAAAHARGDYLKYVDADDMIYPTGLEVLVDMMSGFPDAGYGLCSLDQDVARPYPFQLSPKEAYYRHYFETPLFHKAPLSSIIRADSFRKVGGFPEKRMVSDFEMWHRLSQEYPVVLMPGGIVWYREHDSQEFNDHREYLGEYLAVSQRLLSSEKCPLSPSERDAAILSERSKLSRMVLRCGLTGSFAEANRLRARLELGLIEVINAGLSKRNGIKQ